MQTVFTAEQLQDPKIAEADGILRKCVHCGFCTATCPTYVLLGDERDSPRGRIYMIKSMLERGEKATAETARHIDRCLSCLSCTTTCPSGVDYMHLIDQARVHVEKTYDRPYAERFLRNVLAKVLPNPKLFRLSLIAARLAAPLAPVLKAAGANRLSAMLALAPATLPRPGTQQFFFKATSPRRGTVGLLKGCAQSVLDHSINDAAIRLLNRQGFDVHMPTSAPCCGSLTHHMGKADQAKQSAKAWIDQWQGLDVDHIIITASGCGPTIKDYGHMFARDPLYAAKAQAIASKARDITEYLDALDLPPSTTGKGLRVAYHSACSLQHGQKLKTQPQKLLRNAGFDVVEPRDSHLCCGSAGTYNMLQPEIASKLRDRKAESINILRPDLIAAGNLGCITQLRNTTSAPIIHTIALLDWAYGGEKPASL